jgi:hypothetical protein
MSTKEIIGFTCDGCGKSISVDCDDLLLPEEKGFSRVKARAPRGWVVLDAHADDDFARTQYLPKDRSTTVHICSSVCAVEVLNGFAKKMESAFKMDAL